MKGNDEGLYDICYCSLPSVGALLLIPERQGLRMQVMPELTSPSVDNLPILKADALKFLTLMRGQLSTQAVLSTFGSLATLLRADSNVVHSYASVAIERLLASRVCSQAFQAHPYTFQPLSMAAGCIMACRAWLYACKLQC